MFGVLGTQRGYVDQCIWVIQNGWIVWPYAWRTFGNAPVYQNGYQYFDEFYSFGNPYSTIAFYIPGTEWTTCNDWEICMTCKASSSPTSLWMRCSNQTFIDRMNAGSSASILEMYWAQVMDCDSTLGTSDKELHFGYYNTNFPPKDYWTGWVLLDGSGMNSSIDLYIKNLWVNVWMINQDHGV